MKKLGFIGYGSMGSMLVNGFLSSGVISSDQVIVSNRTTVKLDRLSGTWPGIQVARDNTAVSQAADIVFVCVKPLDVAAVLAEIRNEIRPATHLVSIAASVTLADIQAFFGGKATKVIPSLTAEVKEGISLICHNGRVPEEDAKVVEQLFGSISKVVRINEKDFEVAADLTSCAPGIIAAIFRNYVEAGLRHSSLGEQTAR